MTTPPITPPAIAPTLGPGLAFAVGVRVAVVDDESTHVVLWHVVQVGGTNAHSFPSDSQLGSVGQDGVVV
jgi:hypothetical protein